MLAAYVVGLSLGDTAVKLATVALFVAGCLVLVSAYRHLTGVWVSGFQAGPAGRWATALGALVGTIAIAAMAIAYLTELGWPVWRLAATAFVGAIVLGRRFDTALREQLRAGV